MALPERVFAGPYRAGSLRLHKVPRAHFVGIAGCGMRSLAEVLAEAGWHVAGSDLQPDPAIRQRFEVTEGHRAETIDDSLDLVVHSAAVPPSNAELRRAKELNLESLSYPQMLGRLMESRRGVAIAGTHGKSTTTAMAGEILFAAGLSPTVIAGGALRGATSGGHFGRSRLMLAEACEYRAHFLHMSPQIAVVLSVEPDHFDCFASQADLENVFAELVDRVPSDGLVLWWAECQATRRAIAGLSCAGESFGLTPAAIWRATDLRQRRGYYTFQIRCRERLVCDVALCIPGRHNVLNALAAAAVASHCGATGRAIRAGLARFAGLGRRTELVSHDPSLAVVDDYAHHPTEVAATLASVRQMFPGRRVWCVFQPHQESRTRHLLDEFAHSLQNADRIIVTDVFRAREPDDGGRETAADLALRIAELGANIVQLPSATEVDRHLRLYLKHADVLVTVGAGDIGSVAHGFRHGIGTFRKAG